MEATDNKYTWVQTYKELVNYLFDKENNQKELIEILDSAGVQSLIDENPEGNRIRLEEIDPFSFFCFINKYGSERRRNIFQKIAKELNLPFPEDDSGLPSVQGMKVMMFPFKHQRTENEISILWQFFYSALDDSITNEQFTDIIKINGVGLTKLTECLFYIRPETYFPIDGPTKPYLKKVLGIDPKFKTWLEYLNILKQVKEITDKPFYEISHEAWLWNEEQKVTRHWLFQGNPALFDIERALKAGALTTWRVNAHKEKIKAGDKVVLWASGERRGCYALCEVASDVYEDVVNEEEIPFYHDEVKDEPFDQVELRITHNLAEHPIEYDQIKEVEILSGLKIGNQGTNFSATKEQFEALVELAEQPLGNATKWNELVNVVFKIDDVPATRMFFGFLKRILGSLESNGKESVIYASAINKYIQMTIGSRYVSKIERKNGGTRIGFYIDEHFTEKLRTAYPGMSVSREVKDVEGNPMVWVEVDVKDVVPDDFFDAALSVASVGFNGQSASQYHAIHPGVHNPWITQVALNNSLLEKLLRGEKMTDTDSRPEINYPLNTILYGPPGTGKTYTTIKRAAEIVKGREIEDYDEAKQIFNNQLGETIEFITFHQNYSYEDFIQGLRPDTENEKELTFERVDGIFKRMANRALKNLKDSNQPKAKKRSFEDVFNEFIRPLLDGELEDLEVEMKRVSYFITNVTGRSVEFMKAGGESNHSLSINTLRKMYEAESVMEIQGLAAYYSPLLNKLLKIGKSDSQVVEVQQQNYVLIIDEINRANISRVFGELITLIEQDKRYGRELHIPAMLPSGESFSVPENLYIIGTMNTADKSISLLDIALRRRFDFEAMYPKYEIDGEEIHDVDVLRKINDRIKKLKGHDFQIGHSYFMKNHISLNQRMNRKVIPLLLEYFMNDEKEVREILTHAGLNIQEGSWPLEITGRV